MTEPQGTIQLPPQLSTIAPEVDAMYYAIYWISVAFAVAIFVAMGIFLYQYRRQPGRKAKPTGHNTFLEVFWTFTPLLLLLWLFVEGFEGYVKMSVAPEDSVEIRVRGMQWNWEFEHQGGVIDDLNRMKVPVDTPVKLVMSSSDVLHSFFVPGFRVKRDVVPGMYTSLWFEATTPTPFTSETECQSDNDCGSGYHCGQPREIPNGMNADELLMGGAPPEGAPEGTREVRYCSVSVFCTEYCGAPEGITLSAFSEGGYNSNHATMMADLRVLPVEGYDRFLEVGPPPPPECAGAEDVNVCWGQSIYQGSGCIGCHGNDGVRQQPAPNWVGLWGAVRPFTDGSERVADENYIRQSVLQPQSQIVAGYAAVNMPVYRFSDRQLDAVIAYIRSLTPDE